MPFKISTEPLFPFTIDLPSKLIPRFRELDSGSWHDAELEVTSPSAGVIKVQSYIIAECARYRTKQVREVPIDNIGDQIADAIKNRARELANLEIEAEDHIARYQRRQVKEARILSEAMIPT